VWNFLCYTKKRGLRHDQRFVAEFREHETSSAVSSCRVTISSWRHSAYIALYSRQDTCMKNSFYRNVGGPHTHQWGKYLFLNIIQQLGHDLVTPGSRTTTHSDEVEDPDDGAGLSVGISDVRPLPWKRGSPRRLWPVYCTWACRPDILWYYRVYMGQNSSVSKTKRFCLCCKPR
jgi:hypothetical protein